LIVANSENFAIPVTNHKVGIYLGYLLGDQTKTPRALNVTLVVEGNRFEREDRFAGSIHRLNVFLEPARGDLYAELAERVDKDRDAISSYRLTENAADIAAIGLVSASGSNTDNVISRCYPTASLNSDADVSVARSTSESLGADGCVDVAGDIVEQGLKPYSRVVQASGIAKESAVAAGCIGVTLRIANKRIGTVGRIAGAFGVTSES